MKHRSGKRQLTIKQFSCISIAPSAREKRARADHGVRRGRVRSGGVVEWDNHLPGSSAWHWRCSPHRGNPSHSALPATRLLSQKWQICKWSITWSSCSESTACASNHPADAQMISLWQGALGARAGRYSCPSSFGMQLNYTWAEAHVWCKRFHMISLLVKAKAGNNPPFGGGKYIPAPLILPRWRHNKSLCAGCHQTGSARRMDCVRVAGLRLFALLLLGSQLTGSDQRPWVSHAPSSAFLAVLLPLLPGGMLMTIPSYTEEHSSNILEKCTRYSENW